ncbi:hypothetical protein PENTCL1PPCAC_28161 [Pristionchus entomophagus]|uniref:Uncharacterized protein n=1 Tax=Pristionchus entomophagus TaxID=358040 RepID=A0AAV5UHC2_9BILA|nr:hypothetical protein PENTCL1PPCAC_28161 [Pristionchus entomophagus]
MASLLHCFPLFSDIFTTCMSASSLISSDQTMSSSLLFLSLFCLLGLSAALPVETSTVLPVETTTWAWMPNSGIRKHIDLISEFKRIREEQGDALASTDGTPVDDSMIPMGEIDETIEYTRILINQLHYINRDLEGKKNEYLMMTTTTAVPTTTHRGFFGKFFHDKLGKFFD